MAISSVGSNARPGVCTSTTRPTAPFEGQLIYETDTNRVLIWEGAAWVMVADTDQPPALQLVKTQTVGSAVASVEVTNVFSASFDKYLIQYTDGTCSVAGIQAGVRLGATTAGYTTNLVYQAWGSNTVLGATVTTNAFKWIGGEKRGVANGSCVISFELTNPFLNNYTMMNSNMYGGDTTGGTAVGRLDNTASYTSFTLIPDAGTFTGGTIRVYGYRNS